MVFFRFLKTSEPALTLRSMLSWLLAGSKELISAGLCCSPLGFNPPLRITNLSLSFKGASKAFGFKPEMVIRFLVPKVLALS